MTKIILSWPVGKWKNMPTELKPTFDKFEGGLPLVSYKNGTFYKIIYYRVPRALTEQELRFSNKRHLKGPIFVSDFLRWPETIEIPLNHLDLICMGSDYGVFAQFGGNIVDNYNKRNAK